MNDVILKMEAYAHLNKVPISRKGSVEYLKNLIIKNNYVDILEIGTAIGYTSVILTLINDKINLTTIEKDEVRCNVAKEFIKEARLDKRINLILDDALKVELNKTFDLIYIDASKSHNLEFLAKYLPLLNDNGLIVVDNMYLKELQSKTSKNALKLIAKVNHFKEEIIKNPLIRVEFIDIEDGFALITKA